jgi:hypothetical protein
MPKLRSFDGTSADVNDPTIAAADRAKGAAQFTGFLAQEVETAAKKCDFEFSGVVKPQNDHSPYMLSYGEFVVPLVRAVQEQQAQIEQLRNAVAQLKERAGDPSVTGARGRQHAGLLGEPRDLSTLVVGAMLALLLTRRAKSG